MIQTRFYTPVEPEKFWRNLKRRWHVYSGEIGHFNSESSLANRRNGEMLYHVKDATVFVERPEEKGRVGITANNINGQNKVIEAKVLLEEISKVKLMDRI